MLGNLGKDPEVYSFDNNRKSAKFSLATNEVFKDRNGNKQKRTEWHNVVLYSPLAEIAEKYLKKGSQIFMEGKISYRAYDDKDGNKKYITEIVGRELTMLGRGPQEDSRNTDNGSFDDEKYDEEADMNDNGDLPF